MPGTHAIISIEAVHVLLREHSKDLSRQCLRKADMNGRYNNVVFTEQKY